MKKFYILSFAAIASLSSCDILMNAASSLVPSTAEIAAGLKEALIKGVMNGTTSLNKPGAFLKNAVLKILMPPEVANIESKLRAVGLGSSVDKCINALNEGAENAMGKAAPIFKSAITSLSISDALGILKGENNAATKYLEQTTTSSLHTAFNPEIKTSLDKVGATKYWTDIFSLYNKIPLVTKKVETDLPKYVTGKATTALFGEIANQEKAIRNNVAERTSDLLKKVFNYADTQKSTGQLQVQ